ncbi:T9SS type B sorting domain-containing protein [Croceivirga sp. JEA036]|uniref:T9SS type B sorting domain-containing protein n=1 Tax=Croceivirga sp. JEA036 TaxID=2721162 RepID=UPI00143BA95F|nr:T9SS type B sorting domain-containing protein [Croceivirga sp. JEA036]NJB37365.1 T9SS type B sorting domain-containing protein [Croceivirga sp. JEA036]
MFRSHKIFFIFCWLLSLGAIAQTAPDCSTAIPICYDTPINGGTNGYGVDDFNGAADTGCLQQSGVGTIESNSAWYFFRTGASGQLGFNIGHDSAEDWDFALYRAEDCNALGEPIRCNFADNRTNSAYTGVGEHPSGDTASLHFEDWLTVEPGEQYYLLVNNYTNNNNGFSIQFTGEIFVTNPYDALDCAIIDNLLGGPQVACQGDQITLDATTEGALGYNWFRDTGNGFEQINGENLETLTVINDAFYRVQVLKGSETIISDVQVVFMAIPTANSVADEITCQNEIGFNLNTKDNEVLGAQSPNDYLVSYHGSQLDADLGSNPLPIPYFGSVGEETIYIRVANRQNSMCFDSTQQFILTTLASPDLGPDEELLICAENGELTIGITAPDPDITYSWNTGEGTPLIQITTPGEYVLTAQNNSGNTFCVRTKTYKVVASVMPAIAEVIIEDFNVSNTVTIVPVDGGEFEYRLDSDDFQSSNTFIDVLPGNHVIHMRDIYGCGVVKEEIVVLGFVPFFSPNGDGANETWHIKGIEELDEAVVRIYNRYGKLLKELTAHDSGWDGTFKGLAVPSSDYWFSLSYLNSDGARVEAKYIQNHFALRR